MAHHQRTNHDRMHAVQGLSVATGPSNSGVKHTADEDDHVSDVDEPPDRPIQFSKLPSTGPQSPTSEQGHLLSPRFRKGSLLTQALTSPELTPLSDAEAPLLTSDGGMTSPARTSTPSPPLPALSHANLSTLDSKEFVGTKHGRELAQPAQALGIDRKQEVKVEEGLGRRRCISFACAQKTSSQTTGDAPTTKSIASPVSTAVPNVAPKRTCMLRFACPMKPSRTKSQETAKTQHDETAANDYTKGYTQAQAANRSEGVMQLSPPAVVPAKQHAPEKGCELNVDRGVPSMTSPSIGAQDRRLQTFNRVNFQKSEATRFHEFAGSFTEEDEWTNEQTAFREKITINDTLRKENAIRKIAEEADAEAQDDDDDAYEQADGDLDDSSDGGNETDDEEGFADSDEESDGGSAYRFWTPSTTTAATSTDVMEHIRPVSRRVASESSIESVISSRAGRDDPSQPDHTRARRVSRSRRSPQRSGTTDLPDNSDFVIGTIDEDQPLEEQYLSRLRQKERSKQKLIPQDIDPSFPTSDPEAENDDDEDPEDEGEDEDGHKFKTNTKRDAERTGAYPDSSGEDHSASRHSSPGTRTSVPDPSPRRLHSPPPPSRRLFGQAVHRLRSPPPMHPKLTSPPSSRRPSLSGSPRQVQGMDIARLAQRPNLTHTTSLPRTPNPFWGMHRKSRYPGTETPSAGTSPKTSCPNLPITHGRGPIEIVQGLENKRQRRKEKYQRQHCQKLHAGKEKERKCQPGKGAQRMREVGLVMADRFKGYRQGTKLVLSV